MNLRVLGDVKVPISSLKNDKSLRGTTQTVDCPRFALYENVLATVGATPLIRLHRIGREFDVELLAKLELMNPGGSIKDRIAVHMLRQAEAEGRIQPGDTLIEPTSGNTGIGLAMACAVLGYRLIIVMPTKMSAEKQVTMEALGAQIIRTPTAVASSDPASNFSVAKRLAAKLPRAHILGQFENPNNPDAHYRTTAVEIIRQTGGRFDVFVAGAGTGGTLTGCARRFRDEGLKVRVVGADPVGSLIGGGDEPCPYQVEGIGYDFIPETLDQSLVDEYVKVGDEESFTLAQRLIREEGLLVGGSCGTAMAAALSAASRAAPGSRIVVVLPDSIRNYMSKFLNPDWMSEHGFPMLPPNQVVDWEAFQRDESP